MGTTGRRRRSYNQRVAAKQLTPRQPEQSHQKHSEQQSGQATGLHIEVTLCWTHPQLAERANLHVDHSTFLRAPFLLLFSPRYHLQTPPF